MLKDEAETAMQELVTLARFTSVCFSFTSKKTIVLNCHFFSPVDLKLNLHWLYQELYHEWQALDRFEQDYKRKLAEVESLNLSRRGWSRYLFDQPWTLYRTLNFIFFLCL